MQQFYRNGRLIEWDPERPVITCLMSVYNGETYLREAMDSILDQTYTNFEFLIINDGSTDDTVNIIKSYDDPRIRLVHNEENIGLTKSLNKGIDLANGEYIARMDADDISLPKRFERQLRVISDEAIIIEKNNSYKSIFGNQLILNNYAIHSSFFFKKKNVKYDNKYKYAQDYALLLNFTEKNIKKLDRLVYNRINIDGLSFKYKQIQRNYADNIVFDYLDSKNVLLKKEHQNMLKRIRANERVGSQYFYYTTNELFKILLNNDIMIYDTKFILDYLKFILFAKRLSAYNKLKLILI